LNVCHVNFRIVRKGRNQCAAQSLRELDASTEANAIKRNNHERKLFMEKKPVKVDIDDLREVVGGLTLTLPVFARPVTGVPVLIGHSPVAASANGTAMCYSMPVGPDAITNWITLTAR
jgi:hypothetical protein